MRTGSEVLCASGLVAALFVTSACQFDKSGESRDSGASDALPGGDDGGAPDAMCAWSFEPQHFDPCDDVPAMTAPPLSLEMAGEYLYDTDSGELTAPDDSTSTPESSMLGGSRVLWLERLEVGSVSELRVEGTAPLLVVSTSEIDVRGTIDASSFWDGDAYRPGAGANPSACPIDPPDAGAGCNQHGASGGGGGAFGEDGGRGGGGGNGHDCGFGSNNGRPSEPGGVALPEVPQEIRGGCPGREGAPSTDGDGTGTPPGGPGGGAVFLSAQDLVRVSGIVHVGGAGGRGCQSGNRNSGGGGGSGGLIGLESAAVDVRSDAVLAANGGGGGGGCDHNAAEPGGDAGAEDSMADGGAGEGSGGDGGGGGFAIFDGFDGDTAERGGGGGGGGTGFILLFGGSIEESAGATVSPPSKRP